MDFIFDKNISYGIRQEKYIDLFVHKFLNFYKIYVEVSSEYDILGAKNKKIVDLFNCIRDFLIFTEKGHFV